MTKDRLTNSSVQVPLNLDIKQLTDAFLLSRKTSNYTPKTIDYYQYVVDSFTKWLSKSGQDYASATTLRNYLSERLASGEKPRTTHAHYRGLKAMFNFLFEEELLDNNPMARVKPPKVPKDLLPPLTEQEIRRIEKAISGNSALEIRNRALFYVLLDSGLRLTECLNLKVGDINPTTGVFQVRGKGNKDRIVCVSGTTIGHLTKYLRLREGDSDSPLWIGTQGIMTKDGIAETLERIGNKAGVHMNAHKIRRTFAVFSLRNGMNLMALKNLMGHSSLATTQVYLNLCSSDLQDEHVKASPVASLSKDKLKVG